MALEIKTIKVGRERTNCYVLISDREVAIIDPGAESEKILGLIPAEMHLKYILLTHGHYDHVDGVDGIKVAFPHAPVMLHEDDVKLYEEVPEQGVFVGKLLGEPKSSLEVIGSGETLQFGEYDIDVIATPGHTPGGVAYKIDKYIFTGDTLFYHTIGRTDLPFSDSREMRKSLDRLIHLDEKLIVYPGHGKPSTIGEERRHNPYLI